VICPPRIWQQLVLRNMLKVNCFDEDIESQSFQGDGVIDASIAHGANGADEAGYIFLIGLIICLAGLIICPVELNFTIVGLNNEWCN
jgi:hypothetical protein